MVVDRWGITSTSVVSNIDSIVISAHTLPSSRRAPLLLRANVCPEKVMAWFCMSCLILLRDGVDEWCFGCGGGGETGLPQSFGKACLEAFVDVLVAGCCDDGLSWWSVQGKCPDAWTLSDDGICTAPEAYMVIIDSFAEM